MEIDNLLVLSSMLTPNRYAEIKQFSVGAISNANDTFQKAIIKGIQENIQSVKGNVFIVNAPNIGAFPFKYKKIYFKSGTFTLSTINGMDISFCNLPLYKHSSICNSVYVELNKIMEQANGKCFLLIYGLYWPFLDVACRLKNKYNIKTCLMVPDLPGFTGDIDHWAYRFFKLFVRKKDHSDLLRQIDSYVLLTETMKERLPIHDQKYIVVEGIIDESKTEKQSYDKDFQKKIVFYSGALDQRNGVNHLLEAFKLIDNPSFRLMLCGDGDLKGDVESAAASDSRIIYKGQLPHDEVIKLQSTATLLVNPRMPVEEFTKYSFPSKTMEYLASGTPVLMYQLPTLPVEYFPYCYFIPNTDVFSLSKSICDICLKPTEELAKMGQNARNFILKNKTARQQVKRIINLLTNL